MQLPTAALAISSLLVITWGQVTHETTGPSQYLIHQYANGSWIENLAPRRNGHLLATEASKPNLYSINPFTGANELVYTFPNATGLTGITETTPDLFYVFAGNLSLVTYNSDIGSFSLWEVDYRARGKTHPKILKYMDLTGTKGPNGLITLDAKRGLLLGSDLDYGNVFRIDLQSKAVTVVIDDPLMHPGTSVKIGADGIKIRDNVVYFSNPGKALIGKVAIDSSGNPTEAASVVQPIGGDDFTFDRHGSIFTVGGDDNLTVIYGPDLKTRKDLTSLPGPTAARFGRTSADRDCLYITTCGGLPDYAHNPVLVGGAIYAVDVYNNGGCPAGKRKESM